MDKKNLILIDGNSYLYRAYYALPDLHNSRFEHVGAIYGAVKMIVKLLNLREYDYVAIVFDAGGKTFRKELCESYKIHRKPMPDALLAQIKPTQDIIAALGITVLLQKCVEADDIIGTLNKLATKNSIKTQIVTLDKDMAQLVDDHTTIIHPISFQEFDHHAVYTKYNVYPNQIINYLMLVGDASDNIEGVKGIGKITAASLLKEHQTLDGIIANLGKIKPKIAEKIAASLSNFALTEQLARIKTDLELNIKIDELHLREAQRDVVHEILERHELNRLKKDIILRRRKPNIIIAQDAYSTNIMNNANTTINKKDLFSFNEKINASKLIAFASILKKDHHLNNDFQQTTSSEIAGFTICTSSLEIFHIPISGDDEVSNLVLQQLKNIFENENIRKVGFDIKSEMHLLDKLNISLKGVAFDVMLESYAINGASVKCDFQSLSEYYLNDLELSRDALLQREADIVRSKTIYQLHMKLFYILAEIKDNLKFLKQVEMPLLDILYDMEKTGVMVDLKHLKNLAERVNDNISKITDDITKVVNRDFNFNSPKQLAEVLYDQEKLPCLGKTNKGDRSTSETTLVKLANLHPLPKLILQYRHLTKLKNTYIDQLQLNTNKTTNRVHTSYNQVNVSTGRLSSSNPNLQNIPIKTEIGNEIRKAFIASSEKVILSADYSQIEMRIMAHMANDKNLIKAFLQNVDVHKQTAAEIFNVQIENVTKSQRYIAKAINFGLIYGISPFGLANQLNITHKAAREYIKNYFSIHQAIKDYMSNTIDFATKNGYVTTIFNRRINLEIAGINLKQTKAFERMVINAPIQGSASDIIKIAMVDVYEKLEQLNLKTKMIIQAHDELVLETPKRELEQIKTILIESMQNAAKLIVPLLVNVKIGDSWGATSIV